MELPPPIGSTLFVHHKPAFQVGYARERELQAVACARFVEKQLAGRDLHVVLMGDFDDTPDSSSVRFWTGRQSLEGFSVAYRGRLGGGAPGRSRTHIYTDQPVSARR